MSISVLSCPRMVIAGLGGGSGKTIVSIGLARAFAENGHTVQTFKKGPDYIDAKWLGLASHCITSNLDPFLLSEKTLVNLFWQRAQHSTLAIIEGNRGLYDGKDVAGSCSTAELAKLLAAPVIVVVDCTKVTRTMAAIILGLTVFDPQVHIRGVILNRTAGQRHQTILRNTIEQYTDVTVLGTLPKLRNNPIPERQMGLLPQGEFSPEPFAELAAIMRTHLNLDSCFALAKLAPPVEYCLDPIFSEYSAPQVRIGVAKDAALWFYYRENLEALQAAGSEIVEFSLLNAPCLPDNLDGLYLGGGFPETLAQGLADNESMRRSMYDAAESGMPIYAECGGLMFLSQSIEYQAQTYPMVGFFPLITKICTKPQGHGYTAATVVLPNPFFPVDMSVTGHEFHYSRCPDLGSEPSLIFELQRGQGLCAGKDGFLQRNTLAGHTHIHALGSPTWAPNFVAAALQYQVYRKSGQTCPDIR